MELWIVVVVSLIPSGLVAWLSVNFVNKLIKEERVKKQLKLKENARATILPIKLQAYERLVILLERIRVNNLVMRVAKPGMNAQFLQREMLKQIRSEFEHNMSQQLYVSGEAWKLLQNAREQSVGLMNVAGSEISGDEDASVFTKKLLQIAAKEEFNSVDVAILQLRNEMNQQF